MKISKNNELISYIYKLENILDLNVSLGEMFSSLFSNYEVANKNEIEIIAKKYNRDIIDVYFDRILDYWEIDLNYEDNESLFENYIKTSFYEISPKEYINNPYFKNIKINNIKDGDYELFYDKYKPYEVFAFDDIEVKGDYIERNKIGFFKDEFKFIALNHKGITWMNITPNEINTMKNGINQAYGDIVVFGLGLGYFPYMASLKDEVKTITIIEKDTKIIDLFNKYIFPQFEQKNKIKIINDDALNHVGSPLKYDFAFVDLWHNPDDGIDLFLYFKKQEKLSPKCKFNYWLNNSFYAYLRRAFISLLIEQSQNYKDEQYKKADNSFDKIINKYYFKTKNITLKNKSDVDNFLLDSSLLNLIIDD